MLFFPVTDVRFKDRRLSFTESLCLNGVCPWMYLSTGQKVHWAEQTRVENSAFECVRETVTIITLYIVQHTEALLDWQECHHSYFCYLQKCTWWNTVSKQVFYCSSMKEQRVLEVKYNLERVQLIFSQVGSSGSLPQFNHTRLMKVYRRGRKQQSHE